MAIQFFNGPLIYNKLRDGGNRFRKLLGQKKSDREIITDLHLAAVSRRPTEEELQASLKHLSSKDEQILARNAEIEQEVAALQAKAAGQRQAINQQLFAKKLDTMPEAIRADLRKAIETGEGKRDAVQKYLVAKLAGAVSVSDAEIDGALDDAAKKVIQEANEQIAALQKQKRAKGDLRIEALEDICWVILNTNEFLFQH